jgi:hypothetical protein
MQMSMPKVSTFLFTVRLYVEATVNIAMDNCAIIYVIIYIYIYIYIYIKLSYTVRGADTSPLISQEPIVQPFAVSLRM